MEYDAIKRLIWVENKHELRLAETVTNVGFGAKPQGVQLGNVVESYPFPMRGIKSALILNGLQQMEPEIIPSLSAVTADQVQEAWHSVDQQVSELTFDPA